MQDARAAAAKPQRPAPLPLSSNVATLCSGSFTPADLRDLLTSLGVLDADTGHWHLGELKGKAAAPLSAFPAAYRALFEAKLMLFADAPVYRKAFEEEFHIKFSDRLATFKDGSGSARFQDYLVEARRWITIWKASTANLLRILEVRHRCVAERRNSRPKVVGQARPRSPGISRNSSQVPARSTNCGGHQ